MTEFATDAVLVFVLGLLIALIRYAWVGYWRMNKEDFIDPMPSTTFRGNHIVVKTPPRHRRGKHLIIIEESVDEKGEDDDNDENGGSDTEVEQDDEIQVSELHSSPSYGGALDAQTDSPTVSLLSSRASTPQSFPPPPLP